ncbi:MAG: glutathione S-transferase family protein [Paracoccaceae bacterium]
MTGVLLYDHPGSICSQMARLALAEKGVAYSRRTIDIMATAEQFQPWYVALNPKAVVPTLRIGDEIVTDTIRIVTRVDDEFDGPPLGLPDSATVQGWLAAIMGLHYGVLLYSARLEADGTSPTIVERGRLLARLKAERPELAGLLAARIDGNARFQAILKDRDAVETHIGVARDLVSRMNASLQRHEFVAGDAYSLADCFATAALARFRVHGFERWWRDGRNPCVAAYYAAMRARPSFAAAGVVDSGTERDM